VNGGGGADEIRGGRGDDLLKGGSGEDTLTGGADDDVVFGGSGDDRAVYFAANNLGDEDDYRGGGDTDTLVLELTQAEYDAAEAEILDYLAFLDVQTAGGTQDAGGAVFAFASFGLSAQQFEALEVVVDGTVVDPTAPAMALAEEAFLF
jgi:Ca2+-binding RTX toxin-like protein